MDITKESVKEWISDLCARTERMVDKGGGVSYAPLFSYMAGMNEVQAAFCFGLEKQNMLALLGDFTIDEVGLLPLAHDINEYMDKQTRQHLRSLPLDFMLYWDELAMRGAMALTKNAPAVWIGGMRERARSIQRNMLIASETENVVHVNFRRRG